MRIVKLIQSIADTLEEDYENKNFLQKKLSKNEKLFIENAKIYIEHRKNFLKSLDKSQEV